ncbi:MAG: hypothetical protein P9M13_00165 [Candidatus Ancaeobacter aquaticus]|nr:hypothetical protein [Candidatus Ancaeobacter aquaticus]
MNSKQIGYQSYTSFKELGGDANINYDILNEEIARMPLEAVLGYLSSLSVQFLEYPEKDKPDILDASRQAEYLKLAIVDDFPHKLPQADRMYCPGRIPYTQGRHLFIHSHNIAYLANLALTFNDRNKTSSELDYELPRRICRVLLIINDILKDKQSPVNVEKLVERHDFVLSWVRQNQFNKYQTWYTPWANLGRNYKLYTEILPNHFPDVKNHFQDITSGISLPRYFTILAHLVALIYKLDRNNIWLNKETLFKEISKEEKLHFEEIISKWSCSPQEYTKIIDDWKNQRKNKDDQLVFDYVTLRRFPLIETAANKIICPVAEFIIDKIIDEPFFILSEALSGKERSNFQNSLGLAYEDYANALVEKISQNDSSGQWTYIPNPKNNKEEEISDCLLQRNSDCFYFEHKGGRLPTDFLLGGKEKERVFGPNKNILSKLDKGEKVQWAEVKREDEGLITEGMWQQNVHYDDLINYIRHNKKQDPKRIFPIITFAAETIVDDVCCKGYLDLLIQETQLYQQKYCIMPQWLQVADLEALVSLAEDNLLNLEELFLEKNLENNRTLRFDIFLFQKFPHRIFYNKELRNLGIKLMNWAKQDF